MASGHEGQGSQEGRCGAALRLGAEQHLQSARVWPRGAPCFVGDSGTLAASSTGVRTRQIRSG